MFDEFDPRSDAWAIPDLPEDASIEDYQAALSASREVVARLLTRARALHAVSKSPYMTPKHELISELRQSSYIEPPEIDYISQLPKNEIVPSWDAGYPPEITGEELPRGTDYAKFIEGIKNGPSAELIKGKPKFAIDPEMVSRYADKWYGEQPDIAALKPPADNGTGEEPSSDTGAKPDTTVEANDKGGRDV